MRWFWLTYLFLSFAGFSQTQSAFNGEKLKAKPKNYSFIVGGHFYGDGNNQSHLPANTLLANLDWVNDSGADMLICTGDLFREIRKEIPNYQKSLFDKLEIPLFNAVGNHDLSGDVYQSNFGLTSFSFQIGKDLHIILDTEQDNGDIEGEQLEMIKEAKALSDQNKLNNLFIYSHRTVWKRHYTELDELFKNNTSSLTEPNFSDEVYPIIEKISQKNKVYWFSGSMGGGPSSFFYHRDQNISYILTGIRAVPRDALLLVNVQNGIVSFETKSLTDQKVEPLEHYDKEYWSEDHEETEFNLGLLWYQFKLMLTHRYFWYGISFALSAYLVLWLFRSRKKRKARH